MSPVGGDGPVAPSLGLAPATTDDFSFSLDNPIDVSANYDSDRLFIDGGLLTSPNSTDLNNDHLAGNPDFFGSAQPDFDLSEFIDVSADGADFMAANGASADHGLSLLFPDLETRSS